MVRIEEPHMLACGIIQLAFFLGNERQHSILLFLDEFYLLEALSHRLYLILLMSLAQSLFTGRGCMSLETIRHHTIT